MADLGGSHSGGFPLGRAWGGGAVAQPWVAGKKNELRMFMHSRDVWGAMTRLQRLFLLSRSC